MSETSEATAASVVKHTSSDNRATPSDELQEESTSITTTTTTTTRSRLLDEMKDEDSFSDSQMDVSDEKGSEERITRRMKFMDEKEGYDENEKDSKQVEGTDRVGSKKRRARGGSKRGKKFRATSREEKQQIEQNIRYRMAHGLLSHAPFHVTARDPPEKVGIQIAKRLKEVICLYCIVFVSNIYNKCDIEVQ
jgi:hypothetical protein